MVDTLSDTNSFSPEWNYEMESIKLELRDHSEAILQYEEEKKEMIMKMEEMRSKYEIEIESLVKENKELRSKVADMKVKIKTLSYTNG